MNKFLFKSTDADFQKLYQSIETVQKNVLYMTHQVDFIRKKVVELTNNKALQTQVDEYFTEDERDSFQESPNEEAKNIERNSNS